MHKTANVKCIKQINFCTNFGKIFLEFINHEFIIFTVI